MELFRKKGLAVKCSFIVILGVTTKLIYIEDRYNVLKVLQVKSYMGLVLESLATLEQNKYLFMCHYSFSLEPRKNVKKSFMNQQFIKGLKYITRQSVLTIELLNLP